MLFAWIEIGQSLIHCVGKTHCTKKCSDYATSVANTENYRVVFVTSLFFFCDSRKRVIPSNPITINVIDFFYVDMASSFYRVESMPCENKNSFINGIFIPFMFCFVSKETAYAGLLDAFASTGSNLKNLKIKKGSG